MSEDEKISSKKGQKMVKQAGTVLGKAQLKLELELYFTSIKIYIIKFQLKMDEIVRSYQFSGPALVFISSKSDLNLANMYYC